MPTGYTAKLCDGGQSFPEFVMGCARAFGALIEMRDEASGAPIPDEFQPSDYHSKALANAQAEKEELSRLSAEDCEDRAEAEHTRNLMSWRKCKRDRETVGARLYSMLSLVQAWRPPTKDHAELKAFMLQQLNETIKFDAGPMSWEMPKPKTGAEWLGERLESCGRNIKYHAEHYAQDVARAKERTAWVRDLRASLAKARA